MKRGPAILTITRGSIRMFEWMCICVCVYVCMCVCVLLFVYVCGCVCVYLHVLECACIYKYLGVYVFFVSVILCLYVVYLERHHPPSALYTLHLNKSTNALLHFGPLNNPPQYTHSNEYTAWQFGTTPLHQASQEGKLSVVKMLLAAGASIDVQTKVSYIFLLLDTEMNTM